jgi:uncharacterized membrane protein (GlpM family)
MQAIYKSCCFKKINKLGVPKYDMVIFNDIFFIKFFISIAFVLALSILSERLSPKLAGFLSGLPTGTALTLFFFGLENGTEFASQSAIFNLAGMIAMQAFLYAYYRTSDKLRKNVILWSSIFALISYAIIIYLLKFIKFNEFSAIIIPALTIPLFIYLFRKIPDTKIKKRVNLTYNVLIFRALIAGLIITAVTSVAGIVGPQWAGLLSAFPTTLFPLILIMHLTYDKKHVHTVIKNVPYGQLSLVFYTLSVFYFYPRAGIYWGTLISYAFVGVYIIIFYFARRAYRFATPQH